MSAKMLDKRHGSMQAPQGGYTVYHWGYGYEPLPCTSDAGTCRYLNGVYVMHDLSMKYSFILWGVLLGIAFVWVTIRGWRLGGPPLRVGGPIDALCDSFNRVKRRWLLKDAPLRRIWGRTTRLQVAILAIISGYLLIFSFVGYIWLYIEPAKPNGKTRTTLGWFSNRVGILAYALTPLTVLLASRESILTMLTGIPYQHFNFMHRWIGRIIFAQAMLHTIGWTVVEAYYYKPSPDVYVTFLKNMYAIFGVVATFLICFITFFSLKPVIRWTGYEFFKITHLIGAILYIGACWGHWDKLWCWMVASLALVVIDQSARFIRTCYLHFGGKRGSIGFQRAQAEVQVIGDSDDMVIRLDFEHPHDAWKPGQHFFLCFPSLSIWQSHPFTVCSSPVPSSKTQHHTYVLRTHKGQTAQLAALAGETNVPVVITGPYGSGYPKYETENTLVIAGGTGVTFTLPIAVASLFQPLLPQHPNVDFIWVVRRARDLLWIHSELDELQSSLASHPGLRIGIYITREHDAETMAKDISAPFSKSLSLTYDIEKADASSSSSPAAPRAEMLQRLLGRTDERFQVHFLGGQHPSMSGIVDDFVARANQAGGNVQVLGSGPAAMGSDLRKAVAEAKAKDLEFYWDSRE